ncbi:hypothetical protein LOK49_LG10G01545 [Camellia lanceoleosa]|uniref:Uncharacterized protein n=1 Tax=Camellia lanceoleosa TaxID=1840588 RepID=A0ACC0GDZ8_9ERIC|nr:hypothetical protein LOK49_LG10G01545 [Camellia lanceoleosa]
MTPSPTEEALSRSDDAIADCVRRRERERESE